jgi:single-strand DNA-binding protein
MKPTDMDLNKAIVCGRLTADPQGKVLDNGTPISTFSIASNRRWKKDGEQQEETEFHNVVVFGKQGEACAAHLRKGNTALVEGRLQTRSWEQDGIRRYKTEIVADRVIFGPRSISADDPEPADKPAPRTLPAYPDEEINPEDIPF